MDKNIETVESDIVEEDEISQDWEQVAKLQNSSAIIPKRGEKDYEPDGTDIQELQLYKARKAMFDTLNNSVRGSVTKSQVEAIYKPETHEALVLNPKGSFLQTMGRVDKDGFFWLTFNEFLYLSERGTITPQWEVKEDDKEFRLPLSIEDLYSFFRSQTEMDNFATYAYLKRLGFIVSEKKEGLTFFNEKPKSFIPLRSVFTKLTSVFILQKNSLFNRLIYSKWNFSINRYRKTADIYQSLNSLISYASVPKSIRELEDERLNSIKGKSDFKIMFNVWKPHPGFKKKVPTLPDFQVATYNKNDNKQHFPDHNDLKHIFGSLDYKFEFLNEIDNEVEWDKHTYINNISRHDLLDKVNRKDPKKMSHSQENTISKKRSGKVLPPHIEQLRRLKMGYRTFILSIMDNGIISFVKISEADFGSENVWYVPSPSGQQSTKRKSYNKKIASGEKKQ